MRYRLHQLTHEYPVHCDPQQPVDGDTVILDLSHDITGSLLVSNDDSDNGHVADNLARARLIFADSAILASIISRHTKARVVPLVWGHLGKAEISKPHEEPIVGVLNQNHIDHVTLMTFQKQLKRLSVVTLGDYGRVPAEVEQTYENIEQFAASIDILLLPSRPHLLQSLSTILAIMSWKTAVMAVRTPLVYEINCPGVVYLNEKGTGQEWKKAITSLKEEKLTLRNRQDMAQKFADNRFRDSANTARIHLSRLR